MDSTFTWLLCWEHPQPQVTWLLVQWEHQSCGGQLKKRKKTHCVSQVSSAVCPATATPVARGAAAAATVAAPAVTTKQGNTAMFKVNVT